MDITLIIVIIIGVVFVVGGLVIGHLATKASEKAEREEANKEKTKNN